ncbi:hypothetical protein [Corynebacterium durum]|uniref:hypothetical protein n=1 Tax=Corynebacterium durum TaxID=61592 RepID=UPI00288A772D|nr:hypothetical protein [Corynebacterium durum]
MKKRKRAAVAAAAAMTAAALMPTAQAAPNNTNIDTTGALPGTTDALMVGDTTSNDDSHVVPNQAELVATVVADDDLPGTTGNTSPAVGALPGTSDQDKAPSDDVVVSETSLPGTSDSDSIKNDTKSPTPSEEDEVLPGTLPAAKRDETNDEDIDDVVVSEAPQPGTSDADSRDDNEDADVVDDTVTTVTEPSVAAAQVEAVQGGVPAVVADESVAVQQDTGQQYTEQPQQYVEQYTEPSGASVATGDRLATDTVREAQSAQQDTVAAAPEVVEVTPTTTGVSEMGTTAVTQQEAVLPQTAVTVEESPAAAQTTTTVQDTTATSPTTTDADTTPTTTQEARLEDVTPTTTDNGTAKTTEQPITPAHDNNESATTTTAPVEDTNIVEPQAVDPSPETQTPATAQQPSLAPQNNDIDQVLSTLAEHPSVSGITDSVRQSATDLGLIDAPVVDDAQVEVPDTASEAVSVPQQQSVTDTTTTGQQYTEQSTAGGQSAAEQDAPVAVEVTPTTTGVSEMGTTAVTQQEAVLPQTAVTVEESPAAAQTTTTVQDTTATSPTTTDADTTPTTGETAGNTDSAAPSEPSEG